MFKHLVLVAVVGMGLLQGGSPSSSKSIDIGSATLRINMPRAEVEAALGAHYKLTSTGGNAFLIMTKAGPPFDVLGSLGFSADGLLTNVVRDWGPSDQQAGVATGESLYNALTPITTPTAGKKGQAQVRLCKCSVFVYETTSPQGTVKHLEVFDGERTVALTVVRGDSIPHGAVTVGESIEK